MIYYDTNQWHWIHDTAAYHQACDTIVRDGRRPEWQADFSTDTTGPSPANEWPMVDIETGVSDPASFLLRWLGRYESRQQRRAALHAPLALWNTVPAVIGDRLKITPSYSRAPWWAPYDVWQDSQTATFPVAVTQATATAPTSPQILARTCDRPVGGSYQRHVQMLND